MPKWMHIDTTGLPKGFDAADLIESGASKKEIEQWMKKRLRPGPSPIAAESSMKVSNRLREKRQNATKSTSDLKVVPTDKKTQESQLAHDPCTHLANAYRIRDKWSERLLHVEGKGWHVRKPDGPWRENRTEALRIVQGLGRLIAKEAAVLAEGSPDDWKAGRTLLKWAAKTEQLPTLRDSLEMARPLLNAKAADMDTNPYLVGLPSKVLDLRTGDFRPYTAQDRITLTVGVDFDPKDKAPTWEAFISEIMDGDQEMIDYQQCLYGYALSGERGHHMLIFNWGYGMNGKSTETNALAAAFGDYAGQAMPELLVAGRNNSHPSAIAELHGKRLMFAAESGEGRYLSEERVKALTGGDPITAKRLYREPFTFIPTHLLVLSTNHRPLVKGTDFGIWRRIRLIPFEVTISEDQQDTELSAKLLKELPGILAWCYAGWRCYQKHGFKTPEKVTKATAQYRNESDVIGQFLDECCLLESTKSVPSITLYKEYGSWCEDNGERPMPQRSLTARLREHGIEPKKGTGGRRDLSGVALLSRWEDTQSYRAASKGE